MRSSRVLASVVALAVAEREDAVGVGRDGPVFLVESAMNHPVS